MRSIPRSDGRRASDAEITRPQNDGPFEAPESPSWHVHLELQPEELVTLHRMGFTSGALAWREGMHDWQPLQLGAPPPLAPPQKARTDRPSMPEVPMALVRRRSKERESSSESKSGPKGKASHPEVLAPRLQAFSRRARSIPPIAPPMAVPLIDAPPLRPNLELLPPPPPVERPVLPESWEGAAQLSSHPSYPSHSGHSSLPHLSDSSIREIKPPSIPPPVEVPSPARRTVSSRALWLGAAALVALSASNGALVSALLWSLRHGAKASVSAPAATAQREASARGATLTPAAMVPAPKVEASASAPKHGGPLSVDELPLATDAGKSGASAAHSKSAETHAASSARSSASTASTKAARGGKGARAAQAENTAEPKRAAAPPSDGSPDRESMNKALMLASASASTCSDGPEKGRVAITFSPSGSVQGVRLLQSFGDASINSCVLRAMGRAHVTPFSGDAVTVSKTLAW